jgi:hypothetical protein
MSAARPSRARPSRARPAQVARGLGREGGIMLNIDTVIKDIDAAHGRHDQHGQRCALCEAQKAAAKAFAEINGWRTAPAFFDLGRLGRGAPTRSHHWADNSRDRQLLDHPLWFYFQRRFVAAVGQPYRPAVDLVRWRAHLTERGFTLHVPPDPLASFHYPGSTLFVVVTRPGVRVRFLPEQDGRLKGLWRDWLKNREDYRAAAMGALLAATSGAGCVEQGEAR